MIDKLKALWAKFKGLDLFLKMVIVIFILFGIGTAMGSPAYMGYILSALIFGAIGYYLYVTYIKPKPSDSE